MRMRTNQGSVIVGMALAAAMVAAGAEAAEAADAEPAAAETSPAAEVPPAVQAPPRAKAPPAAVQAARVKEGFMVIPAIGINSFQGDTGQGDGVGLRIGLVAGSRLAERFSLNLGVAFDKVNVKASGASDIAFDLGLSPLFHFPLEKLEILAGPIVGSFVDHGSAGSGAFEITSWTFGWTLGANAGVMVPVGAKASVGGLVNFTLRNPLKLCLTTNGSDNCGSDNLPSQKVLAVTAAAMF